ncbi:ABC transporter ATP-binding protein [uncultured Clostridium sp.]|uniref:ABC transporter ATP-binding protein n=1 Tax=uncultured Clostridium sp. TaxID=59620 RepID=UPI00261115F9|nr:ABC transporter ATP-binding protein [uncultured Clostridium sp.]
MLKKDNDISILKVIKTVIPMMVKASKSGMIICIVVGFLISISWFSITYFTEKFFDQASILVNGESSIEKAVLFGIMLGVALLVGHLINAVLNAQATILSGKAAGYITNIVNKKVSRIQTIEFEDTSRLNDINKANNGAYGVVHLVFTGILILTGYLSYFIFMSIYLYKLNPILSLVILCAFIPVIINQVIRIKIFAKLEDESAPLRREFEYNEKYLIDREFFKETRLLGGFKYFNKRYENSLESLNEKIWKAEKKSNTLEILMKSFTIVGYGLTLYLLFRSLMDGKITVGAFTAVLTSIEMIFGMAEELICSQIGGLAQELGSVKNLVRFLEIPEKGGKEIEFTNAPSLELKNISFSYPQSDTLILKDINLKIDAKETIAIVGSNGAGKSTLMRVLIGLYPATKGEVLINGYDMKNISNESIFKNTSAVFQKFERYKFDLRENITISDINNSKDEKVLDVLDETDIEVNSRSFENGLDTLLSKEFGGTDLSGGQWQRVAIARSLYKFNNFIVLDEPTAAIDPVEEGKIFNKFKELSKDKTAIIVTHRMGTVKIADRVVVLDKGEILQIGTHEELLSINGQYKTMYDAQSKWYDRSLI